MARPVSKFAKANSKQLRQLREIYQTHRLLNSQGCAGLVDQPRSGGERMLNATEQETLRELLPTAIVILCSSMSPLLRFAGLCPMAGSLWEKGSLFR